MKNVHHSYLCPKAQNMEFTTNKAEIIHPSLSNAWIMIKMFWPTNQRIDAAVSFSAATKILILKFTWLVWLAVTKPVSAQTLWTPWVRWMTVLLIKIYKFVCTNSPFSPPPPPVPLFCSALTCENQVRKKALRVSSFLCRHSSCVLEFPLL